MKNQGLIWGFLNGEIIRALCVFIKGTVRALLGHCKGTVGALQKNGIPGKKSFFGTNKASLGLDKAVSVATCATWNSLGFVLLCDQQE